MTSGRGYSGFMLGSTSCRLKRDTGPAVDFDPKRRCLGLRVSYRTYFSGPRKAALDLSVAFLQPACETIERLELKPHPKVGHSPPVVVPAHAWQAGRSLGAWWLVGCVVAPGFGLRFPHCAGGGHPGA